MPWRFYYRVQIQCLEFFNSYYGFWQRLVMDDAKPGLFQPNLLTQMDIEVCGKVFLSGYLPSTPNLRYNTP